MATDPICGMYVDEASASLRLTREGRTYYFCATSCLEQFAAPGAHRAQLERELAVAWPLAAVVAALTYLGFPFLGAPVLAAALAAVVQFYSGRPFYRGTLDAVRSGVGNMDVLIAVGTSAAFGYSLAAVVLPGRLPPALYFDASSLIVALILTGNLLEQWTRDRAGSTLRRLGELVPRTAHRTAPTVADVSVDSLEPGDRVQVRAGERFPADGVVRNGRGTADEAMLTGEPLPVPKFAGEEVWAGALNGPGLLEVEVTRVGPDRLLAQIGQLVAEAETSRVPLQRLADRIAAAFVPFVLTLAVVAGLGWALLGHASATDAVLVFVTVVIIACPCAFGIATPAAVVVGTGRAADAGILFRGHDAIERAARVDLVLTDKTGTLTAGRPVLRWVRPVVGTSEADLLSWAVALEAGSAHPFAGAVRERAAAGPAPMRTLQGVVSEAEGRLRGTDGTHQWELGSVDPTDPGAVPDELLRDLPEGERDLASWSIVRRDGATVGLLGFADEVAPTARGAVESLRRDGIGVAIVTGDRREPAERVARTVGIASVHAGARPADKLSLVRSYQASGHRVAFVGDGVNDAAALAAADVGIAIGSGSEVAQEAGQIVLLRSDFAGVPLALRVARRTVSKVRQNLRWAVGYNAVLLPVAAGALVPLLGFSVYLVLPVAGAVAMAVSSTTVVLNSFSLRWVSLDPVAPAPAAAPAA